MMNDLSHSEKLIVWRRRRQSVPRPVAVLYIIMALVIVLSALGRSLSRDETFLERYFFEWADNYYGGPSVSAPRFRRFHENKKVFFFLVKNNYRGRSVFPFIYRLKKYAAPGKMDNYWRAAKKHGVTIDTVIGANPYLKNLKSGPDEEIIMLPEHGVLHLVQAGETLTAITELYGISTRFFRENNHIRLTEQVQPGEVYFIPKSAPRVFTPELARIMENRKMFRTPCQGSLGRYFGVCIHPILNVERMHNGIDIGNRQGTPVFSAAAGTVIFAGPNNGYGNFVMIQHDHGYRTCYAHLYKINVHVGQIVKQHVIIGLMGNTGRSTTPHLHFEVRENMSKKGKPENYRPVDPLKYIW